MSDKDRKKKDGRNKDKINKARKDSENPRKQTSDPAHQARAESNLTDTEPGAADPDATNVSDTRITK